MGDLYARELMGLKNPRIGLLSNGEEEGKGNDLTRETHALLTDASFNYVGYVEGRDIYNGKADVVVCDGFVGNVVLKASEGLATMLTDFIRQEFTRGPWAKAAALVAMPVLRPFCSLRYFLRAGCSICILRS